MSKQFFTQRISGQIDLLALHNRNPQAYPFFLETSAKEDQAEAFDILFAYPQSFLEKRNNGQIYLDNKVLKSDRFLDEFDALWLKEKDDAPCGELPFTGGWFIYLGYELVNEIEPGLHIDEFDTLLPIAFATRIPAALIYSHKANITWLVCEEKYPTIKNTILQDIADLSSTVSEYQLLEKMDEEPAERYISSLHKIHDYIIEGDVFQVNLSRKWRGSANKPIDATAVYRNLRKTNPAPFSALVQYNQLSIVSSSPERLVRVQKDKVETRPIAGTRPRGVSSENDNELRDELIRNYKERAEHIMLIDLERNDLGRICQPGTIKVDELMSIESYAHVHHIVSNISGQLKPQSTPGNVIRAVFPGGTITGCPKVRCMQIIKELEQSPRGAYTGSLGYVNNNGDMDLNILIRTLTIHENEVVFRAGAGIVADSVPENELNETRAKAKGMLLAISQA